MRRFFNFAIVIALSVAVACGTLMYWMPTETEAEGIPPFARPSAYYTLPHQSLSVHGAYFTPGETVTIRRYGLASLVGTVVASSNGSFAKELIPAGSYQLGSTTQYYTLMGNVSRHPVTFGVVVGTYYPQITPSTYYASRGDTLILSGQRFAPNEPVWIYENGQLVDKASTNVNGAFARIITAPAIGNSVVVRAVGAWSGTWSARTITLR